MLRWLALGLVPALHGQDAVRVADMPALRAALVAAKPGTAIALAPGDYAGFSMAGIIGSAARPIVLRAEDPMRPPRFRGGVHLQDCAHLHLESLLIEGAPGNGLNCDDGGTFESPAHHLVLRKLTVRDCGGEGNDDGIKLSGVVDLRVEACVVERWGRGGAAIDMVGCARGVIEGCTFRDRAEGTAATGVQMKGGSRDIAVRDCRFEHAGERGVNLGGSTGRAYFRPAPAGFEAKDVLVEGCTFLGATAPIAFVGVDGAIVRHNTIYLPGKWVMRILQETRAPDFVACRRGVFTDNLIVYRGDGPAVNIGPDTAPATFTFARNYWYRVDAPARSQPRLPASETDSAGGANPQFCDAERGDLQLRDASPARAYGATARPRERSAK
jgi:hypothetical protein